MEPRGFHHSLAKGAFVGKKAAFTRGQIDPKASIISTFDQTTRESDLGLDLGLFGPWTVQFGIFIHQKARLSKINGPCSKTNCKTRAHAVRFCVKWGNHKSNDHCRIFRHSRSRKTFFELSCFVLLSLASIYYNTCWYNGRRRLLPFTKHARLWWFR